MGEYGNTVNLYDTHSFFLHNSLQVGTTARSFVFACANRNLVVMTTDCRLRYYALSKYEGQLLRELTTVHRGSITCMDVSSNAGYLATGGEDQMIKLWDYEALKNVPFYFQAFIGHTSKLRCVKWLGDTLVSCGERDGIYVWKFYGDTNTQFYH